jgi:hypothetical protein
MEENKMKRTLTLALAALTLGISAILPATAAFAGNGSFSDFEKELAPWKASAANATYVTEETLKLKVEDHPYLDIKSNGFAALTRLDGNMVWMQTAIPTTGSKVRIEFQARNRQNCEGCIPLVYVGRTAPTYPGQFATDYIALDAQWTNHKLEIKVPALPDKALSPMAPTHAGLVVAISFTNLDLGLAGPGVQQVQGMDVDNLAVTVLDSPADH